ncbi:uncharacterized protein LOC106163341 [Lingula anatina]|uniref:Uncharacterized protein LOC106163341 n=1 Tax=Lingula anatina TaxID=7574 RepID=A0A2R2MTZ2_LINAN|nr:uncharacterized protein LOC106163341 [Lingula anatina]|eukprot:XP_023933497.1 uncharacterized protein LOC106163341 [Lingula anatina]
MTNNTFDYENDLDHFFNVTVYASDGVNVAQMEFALTLVDINDNAPIFNQTHYVFTMPAAAKSGYKIGSVYAKDMDSQSYVTYSISDTVSFAIDSSTGLITRAGSACIYGNVTLTVSAMDGKYTSAAEVVISVTSENAYPPVFNQSVYSFTLDRIEVHNDIDLIRSNMTLKATDDDNQGRCISSVANGNGVVTYKFLVYDIFYFTESGSILILKDKFLEYDKPTVSLTVVATDNAIKNRKTGTTTLVIKISNQKPVFNDSQQMVTLSADADVNSSVTEIEAVDKDENSTTLYSIVRGDSDYFKIDKYTGILQLKKKLPQSNNDSYMNVVVEARDPVLEEVDADLDFYASNLDVIITIVQPNKNLFPPKFQTFDGKNISDTINEEPKAVYYNGIIGSIHVHATDGDDPSKPQGQLVYSLEYNCHKLKYLDQSFVWNITQNASNGTIQHHGNITDLPVMCYLNLNVRDNGVVVKYSRKTIPLLIYEEPGPSTTTEAPTTTEGDTVRNSTCPSSNSSDTYTGTYSPQQGVNMAAVGTLAAVNGILIILLILSYWKTLKKCKKPSFKLKRETTFTPSEGDTGYDVHSMFPSGDYSYIKDVAPNPPPRPQFTLPKLKNPPGGKGNPLQTDDGDVNKSYLSLRAPDSSAEGYKHLVSKPNYSVYADRYGSDEAGSASRVGSQISLQKEKHFVEDESWQRATYRQGSQSPGRQKTQTDPVTMSRPSKSGSSIGQTVVFSGPINITNISQPNRTAILPPLRQMPKMLDKHKQGGNDEKSADTSLEDGAPQGEAQSSIEAASEKLAEALSNKIENSQGEMWSIDQGHLHELSHGSKTIMENIYEKEFPGTKTKTVTDEIEHKPALDSSTIPLSSQPVKTGQGDHSLSHVESQENDCKSDETIDDIDIEETEASQNGDSDPLPSYPSATRPNSSDVVTRRENQYDLPPKSGRLSIATHKPSQYEPNLVAPENNPPNCQEKPHPPRCFLENEKPQSPTSFKENIGSSLESVNVPELENLRPGSASSTTFTVISDDGAVQYGKRRTSLASSEIDAHIPILEDSKTHTENSWKLKPKRKVAPSPSDPVHFEPGEAWNMSNLDIGKKGAGEEIFVHDEQDFEGASRPSYNDLEPDYEDNNHQPFGGETSYHSPDDGSIRAYVPQSSQDSVTPKKKKKKLKKKKSNSTEKKKKTPKVKSTEGFGEYTNQWESTF